MPGRRITDLTALSGAGSANNDDLVIFDANANETKRISRSQLADGLVGDLPYTPSGGISATTVLTAIAELDTEKQPLDPTLTALAGLSTTAGDYIEATGSDTFRTRKLAVATYAALTAIAAANRFDDMLVYVASRSADGDGGEGYWRFDAGSSATANGGTILAPDAGSGRWFRQYAGNVSVKWFGAVPGGAAATNTTAIQAAIDFVYAQPNGGEVQIIGNYDIDAALLIGQNIHLQGPGRLSQTTNDTPIIIIQKNQQGSFWYDSNWGITGVDLVYATNQPNTATNAIALKLSNTNNHFTWGFVVENLRIQGAHTGILAPELTNNFAFLATFNNVEIVNCSAFGFYWLNANTGGSTHLSMNNVWVNNIAGQEIAGSRGFHIRGCASLCINSIAVDHIQDRPVFFESCVGNVGLISIESCDTSKPTSGDASLYVQAGGRMNIGEITLENNTIQIGGTAFAAGVRISDAAYLKLDILRDNFNAVADTSTDAYYTASATSNSDALYVKNYFYGANTAPPAGFSAAPNGSLADFVTPLKIREFSQNVRRDVRGGKQHIFVTAVPSTGTWAVGDTAWNTDPTTGNEPIAWVCYAAGTPGTWFPIGAPREEQVSATDIASVAAAINTTGKFLGKKVWDTTNTRMMRASGSAAADPWVVIDGSASVTPS